MNSSTTDTDGEIKSPISKSKKSRARGEPSRYGDRGIYIHSDFDSNSSDPENLYDDDSFEDKNYSPEKKRRKTGNVLVENSKSNALETIDLNEEFNEIRTSISKNKTGNVLVDKSKSNALETIDLNKEFNEMRTSELSSQKRKSCSSKEAGENDSPNKPNKEGSAKRNCEFDMQLLIGLQKNSIEILARISLIEESLMKNGVLKVTKSENISQSNDHSMAFFESNNLPLQSIEHIDIFESRLQGEAFRKTAVRDHILLSTLYTRQSLKY